MIVVKFGGTSVGDAEAIARAAEIVRSRLERRPLVVVSALAGTTNALLQIAEQAATGQLISAARAVTALRDRHVGVAEALLAGWSEGADVVAELSSAFDELASLAEALSVLGHLTPRSHDAIAAKGELISSALIVAAFRARGLPVQHVDPTKVMVTDDRFGRAEPRTDRIAEASQRLLRPLLDEGVVPLTGGYVGATDTGIITTLGRGGSDLSASLFGAALGAESIEIWTDVDGMLTADPRVVPGATLIERIRFDEASELASFGAKVLHPNTIAPAVRLGIPVYILQLAQPGRHGHADHVRRARLPGARDCRQDRYYRDQDPLRAHAAAARLPAHDLRGVRASSHIRRCGGHLRGQRERYRGRSLAPGHADGRAVAPGRCFGRAQPRHPGGRGFGRGTGQLHHGARPGRDRAGARPHAVALRERHQSYRAGGWRAGAARNGSAAPRILRALNAPDRKAGRVRIGIIGDGKMGRAIAALAAERGIEVVALLGLENQGGSAIAAGALQGAEAAVEFTEPHAAVANAIACAHAGIPVVMGTTGWYDRLEEVKQAVTGAGGALLWSPNYSVGVALFNALVERAGQLFADASLFDVHIIETHHAGKKDAPSGTAAALAGTFAAGSGRRPPITSVRTGHVPGTHELLLDAFFEQVRLVHTARDRRVFADGALLAAAWLRGRRGVFTMRDVLGLEPERNG